MSASLGSVPPPTGSAGQEGSSALLAALEGASAAIFCLTAGGETVWANARARDLGLTRADLPVVDGRSASDVIDGVLGSGRPETVCGRLGAGAVQASLVVRPLQVSGVPAVLVIIETDEADTDASAWPKSVGDVVDQAQLSLLPLFLPLMPDLRLSGSYHRASSPGVAGGDWYDAVPLGSGRVALVVGDAVGHGAPAAGAMSRLRGAMRSTVLHDAAPDAVLAALDEFAGHMADVEGASVFYCVLDVARGRLRYAAAGHPNPLLVTAEGATSFLSVTPRPPLGSPPAVPVPVAEAALNPGDTLVLFSNGAVTGSDPRADRALDRLAEVVRAVLQQPGALDADGSVELAAAITEGVRGPDGFSDDVAVLVVHRSESESEPLHLELTAVPSALPGVRRRMGSWLNALGMGEQDRVGVMVAVGEACANAAEHAYRGTEPGPMSVTGRVDVDGVLTVTVRDYGTWQPPDRDPGDRGRGLLIMRQLVDGVVLEEGGGTTVTLSLRLRRTADTDVERATVATGVTVSVDREGQRPVVRVAGAVDETGAEQLRIRLLEASRGGTGRIELDLTEVSLFSSAGVRVVLAIARIARDEGWRLVVHAREGGITRHVLEISGLAGLVELR